MKKNLHAKFLVTIFQILIFSGGLLAQPSGWIAPNTGVNATILIPGGGVTVNGSSISTGDVIGVFFTSGSNQLCGGIIVYDANEVNTALSAWGDDSTTPTKDGFATNEAFIFKVWLAQTNQIVDMIPTFTPLFQIQETYTTNGMYWVTLVGTSAAPSLTASTSVVNSGCFGTCTGAVDLTVSGGTAPYTYLWSNGATTQDLANLCAGTYSVTVSGGGTTTATAIVSTASQLTVNSTHSNVSCFGGANGSISLTVSGGTSPYSFLWNNGSVLQNRTGLVAGTYTVTVTDQNLCTASHIVVITQPNALSSSISGTDVTTVGGSNGSADLSVSGGTLPYSYLWSNAAITQDINGLSAGTFTVTVTDFNGCTTISSVIIGQPSIASLSATIAGTNVSCFGSCNGSADLSVSGGTAPYTYLWSNGALTQDISQLCPGTYSVTVNDAAGTPGVPFTWTYNITAGFGTILISPGVVTISNQAIQVGDYIGVFYQNGAQQNCGGYVQWDGSTTAIAVWGDDSTAPGKQGFNSGDVIYWKVWRATGGQVVDMTATYDIVSFPGATTYSENMISSLLTLTGTAATGGQSVSTSVVITQPTAISASVTGTNVLFFGGYNGSANLTVSGGTPPYAYFWSNGAITEDLVEITAGIYEVTVTDFKGCVATASIMISQPSLLLVNGLINNVICYNSCTGSIDATVTGGVPPYSYMWSNGAVSQDLVNLCAGSYSLTVYDAVGMATSSFIINSPDAFVASANAGAIECNGESTMVNVFASGGTPPYSGTASYERGAGVYSFEVSDANGCQATVSVTIVEPPALIASSVSSGILCNGGTATVTVSATGGTAPYLGTGQFPLTAGSYSFTVTDANGCSAVTSIVIAEPVMLTASSTSTPIQCFGGTSTVIVSANGGMTPYSGTGQHSVGAGPYSFTVTDVNGCTAITSGVVYQPATAISCSVIGSDVLLYGGSDGSANLTVAGGTIPYFYNWSNGATTEDIFGLSAGVYSVTVTDANGCITTCSVTIYEPTVLPLQISLVGTSNLCFGLCNGSISLSLTGGVPPFSYAWSNGASTQNLNNLCAGNYSVTVFDNNSSMATGAYLISEPTPVVVNINYLPIPCFGGSTLVNVSATGGTAPYVGTGSFVAYAGPGAYTITDANGCAAVTQINLTQPLALNATFSRINVSCYGGNDGLIQVAGLDGTPPYTVSFSSVGGMVQTITLISSGDSYPFTNLFSGNYAVTIIDANGCYKTYTGPSQPVLTINQPTELLVSLNSQTNVLCFGNSTGAIDVNVFGGTPSYSYSWTRNGISYPGSQDLAGIPTGEYALTVYDGNNCSDQLTVLVTQPASALSCSVVGSNVSVYGGSNGSADLSVIGGTIPYIYNWSNGATTQDILGLSAGIYTVTVTDANGCVTTCSVTIYEPTVLPLQVNLAGTNNMCFGYCNGSISLSLTGGVPPFSYSWSNGAFTQNLSNLCAGTYTVTVTDASVGQSATGPFNWNYVNTGSNHSILVPWPDALINGQPISIGDYIGVFFTSGANQVCGGYIQYSGGADALSAWGDDTTTPVKEGFAANEAFIWKVWRASTGQTVNMTATYDVTSGFFQSAGTYAANGMSGCSLVGTSASAGASVTASVVITQPAQLVASYSATAINCFGGTAIVTINAAGGTAPYLGTGNFVVTAGTYSYTVSDANGCTSQIQVNISQPDQLVGQYTYTPIPCIGGTSTVNIQAIGGTAPYTGIGQFVVSGGSQEFVVTDANNCSFTISFVIPEPSVLTSSAFATPILCAGGSSVVSVSATGGTYPYYGTGNFTVNAGTHAFTVTDVHGCQSTVEIVVSEPAPLSVNLSASPILCTGGASNVVVTATGGVAPYNYMESFFDIFTEISLYAGYNSVLITDANGCYTEASITIQEPADLIVNAQYSPILCNGGISHVNIFAIGGTAPYYLNSSEFTGTLSVDVTAGNNSFEVVDANGCSAFLSLNISEPDPLVASYIASPIPCFGGYSTISISATGGTLPYSGTGTYYETAGSYNQMVIDANGCVAWVAFNITEPELLVASVTATPILCNGGLSEVVVSAIGGTMPYEGTGSFQLGAGSYTFTVTDVNGCMGLVSITIDEPQAIEAFLDASLIPCSGGISQVVVNATGGTAPYYFNNTEFTGMMIFDVPAGNYNIEGFDSNGCAFNLSLNISEPEPLVVNYTASPILCFGGYSTISISANGGTLPYSGTGTYYETAGNYNYPVIDANGCEALIEINISEPEILIASVTATPILCNGGYSEVVVFATGGTMPYEGIGTFQLSAGSYTFTVTDINGCMNIVSVTIDEPQALQAFVETSLIPCSGGTSQIIVNAIGGTGVYTGTGSFTLEPGFYSFTITDENNCWAYTSIVIEPQAEVDAQAIYYPINCFGGLTTIMVSATGGTEPYQGTGQFEAGAGLSTYVVTDANGCTDEISVEITQPLQLLGTGVAYIYPNGFNVTCGNCSDGMIDVSVTGGTAPYMFSWNNGAVSEDISQLAAGVYYVTVFDANGCMLMLSVELFGPPSLEVVLNSNTDFNGYDVSCWNSNDGSVSAYIYGVNGSVSYLWSNGETSQTIGGLSAGNYQVTVTYNPMGSVGGAFDWDYIYTGASHIVFIPENGVVINNQSISVGDYIGAFYSLPTGGMACGGYIQYAGYSDAVALWADDNQTPAKEGFSEGEAITWKVWRSVDGLTVDMDPVYDVNFLNQGDFASNGISGLVSLSGVATSSYAIGSINLSQPDQLMVMGTVVNESCGGANNGSISISISGGIAPYSILWSNGAISSTIVNLAPGIYTCTVTDVNGCTAIASFVVTGSAPLGVTGVTNNVLCNGAANGSITLSVIGGIPPYSYSWSNGSQSQSPANLAPGIYSVIVTDASGCTSSALFTIAQPNAISLSYVSTNVLCYNTASGTIDLSVTGGTMPYTYLWSNSSVNQDLMGVSSGTYKVTVTDANGCTKVSGNIVLTQPLPITVTRTITNVSCNGGSNGVVNITVANGTSPYSYIWSNGMTVQDANQVPAGVYSVTITDANGCNAFGNYTVTQPTQIVVNGTVTNVLCNGQSNGAITLSTSGGTPAYSYYWSTGSMIKDISGLAAGVYTVYVTDSKACLVTKSFTVTQPVALNATASISQFGSFNVSAWNANDGFISVLPSGGTSPYSYLWNNGSTTSFRNMIPAGVYSVTITDANQCSTVKSYTLIAPPQPIPLTVIIPQNGNVLCNGAATGSATAVANGGNPPYSYVWSTIPTQYGANVYGLAAGTYYVTVTDGSGSTATNSVLISQPAAITLSVVSSNVSCAGSNNGSADLTVSGGVAPYSYMWSGGVITQDRTNLLAGNYLVIVTDANACTALTQVVITQPTPIVVQLSKVNVACYGSATGSVGSIVSGGTAPYSYLWNNASVSSNLTNVPAGSYSVTVMDANGCTGVATIFVSQPSLFTAFASGSSVGCNGGATGTINVTVTGGIMPYTYLWNDNATTEDRTGLVSGNYSIVVTDANGCTTSVSYFVGEATAILVSGLVYDVTCPENNDGLIELVVTGGTAPFNYLWSTGDTDPYLIHLPAGTYSVTVTDANACTGTQIFVVNEPDPIDIQAAVQNVYCYGNSDGSIDISVTGGTGPYSFYWSNYAESEDLNGISAGTYRVVIIDFNGCSFISDDIIVSEPSPTILTYSAINVTCQGGNSGSIDLSVTGGVAPYTYVWSTGSYDEDQNNLSAGTYSVTVFNANGCMTSATIEILGGGSMSLSLSSTNVSCNGGSNGSINLTVNGGLAPYSYLWSNSLLTEDVYGLTAGAYSVSVIDANGCTAQAASVLTQPNALTLNFNYTVSGTWVMVAPAVSGGTPGYTYYWTYSTATIPYATSISNKLKLKSGNSFSLTVTDSHGCQISGSGVVPSANAIAGESLTDYDVNRYNIEETQNSISDPQDLVVNVYPNPSVDGTFYINIDGFATSQLQVIVNDVQGRQVYTKQVNSISGSDIELSLSNLKPGVYHLSIGEKSRGFVAKRLVITE